MMQTGGRQCMLTLEYEKEEQLTTVLQFLDPILVEHTEIIAPFQGKRSEIIIQA